MLSMPRVYSWAQTAIGADRARRVLVERYLAPVGNVLELGCGPGDLVPYLNARSYVGYDVSDAYVAGARGRHGHRAEFHVASVERVVALESRRFDRVIAIGVLHHLDDATATALFAAAHALLAPGGRCVTMDPVFVARQHPIAQRLARNDHGKFVREAPAYEALARTAFTTVETRHHDDLLRVPYDHFVMTCN